MKKETTTDDVMEMLEKPLVEYVIGLLGRAGMKITEQEAKNLIGNVGTRLMLKNLKAKQ